MPRQPAKFKPHPFAYHQQIELEIETLTNLGAGLGRLDNWVVFVAGALPGEKVLARVYRNHKNHSEADLIEIIRASPERVEPPCPVFGECGGCQYQNLRYESQLRVKQEQVSGLLRHMAGIDFPVQPTVPSPRTFGYRSKITPHFQRARDGEIGPIGFLQAGRRYDLVDIPHCPIAMDALNNSLGVVRDDVRARAADYPRKGATLLLRASSDGSVITDPRATCTEEVEGIRFHFLAGDFFQNNPFILPAFTRHVREQVSASGAPYLLDAYCGSGLFALTSAAAFEKVLGVELSASAVERARLNAEANGITNATFAAADAGSIFADIPFSGSQTAVVIDPPRRGCDSAFLAQLFNFQPRTVVYVSCNPATQMRDLQAFLDNGYQPRHIQPFDLFPQTRHLECVITLEYRGSDNT